MVNNFCWVLFNLLTTTMRCIPLSAAWDLSKHGRCIDPGPIFATSSSWSVLTELMIWSLPIPMVWRLNTSRANKIALTSIFAVGFLDIAIGIARVITITRLSMGDPAQSQDTATFWVIIEQSISISVVCAPVCGPFVQKFRHLNIARRILEIWLGVGKTSNKSNAHRGDLEGRGAMVRVQVPVEAHRQSNPSERSPSSLTGSYEGGDQESILYSVESSQRVQCA